MVSLALLRPKFGRSTKCKDYLQKSFAQVRLPARARSARQETDHPSRYDRRKGEQRSGSNTQSSSAPCECARRACVRRGHRRFACGRVGVECRHRPLITPNVRQPRDGQSRGEPRPRRRSLQLPGPPDRRLAGPEVLRPGADPNGVRLLRPARLGHRRQRQDDRHRRRVRQPVPHGRDGRSRARRCLVRPAGPAELHGSAGAESGSRVRHQRPGPVRLRIGGDPGRRVGARDGTRREDRPRRGCEQQRRRPPRYDEVRDRPSHRRRDLAELRRGRGVHGSELCWRSSTLSSRRP